MASAEGNVETKPVAGAESAARSTSAPPPRPKKRRRPVDDDDDEIPVVGGRFLIAAGLVAVATFIPLSKLGEILEPRGPQPTPVDTWAVGVTSTVRITLVTADYNLLACASEQAFEGVHCAYKSPTESWPREPGQLPDDNKLNIVQPYRTWFDNKLVFVAGLWAEPEVAFRLHREPPAGVLPDKLARFAVECSVKFVGRFDNVKIRWNPQQSWGDPDAPAWVAKAQSCKLIDESQ